LSGHNDKEDGFSTVCASGFGYSLDYVSHQVWLMTSGGCGSLSISWLLLWDVTVGGATGIIFSCLAVQSCVRMNVVCDHRLMYVISNSTYESWSNGYCQTKEFPQKPIIFKLITEWPIHSSLYHNDILWKSCVLGFICSVIHQGISGEGVVKFSTFRVWVCI